MGGGKKEEAEGQWTRERWIGRNDDPKKQNNKDGGQAARVVEEGGEEMEKDGEEKNEGLAGRSMVKRVKGDEGRRIEEKSREVRQSFLYLHQK